MTIPFPTVPDDDVPTFRVRNPDDLLALAPIVIGFELEQSVVIVTFGGMRPFSARVDLPVPCGSTGAAALADMLVRPASDNHATGVVLLLYSDDEVAAGRVFRALRRRCWDAGIRLIEALRADGRRYYPLLVHDRRVREVGVPYDVSDHPFHARAVLEGRVVHASREALAASFAPDPPAQRALAAALDTVVEQVGSMPVERTSDLLAEGAWVESLVRRQQATGRRPSDRDAARLLLLLRTERLRDAAWSLLRRANAREHLELWRDLARRAPDELLPAPAALAGYAAWLAGDGASAWIAIDRCREVDPAYDLAGVVAEVLERAMPPEYGEPTFDWRAGLGA